MNEDRLRKKREKDIVHNLNEDRLKKKREKYIVHNLNKDRLRKKRKKDIVENMAYDRITKSRTVQQVIKFWPHKTLYLDFGDMDHICPYCSASFRKVKFSKKSCCHFGKVKLSPLSDYDESLKYLLLYDRQYRYLIRYYNNRFSFASFNANVINEIKSGIYNLKIQGHVCHRTPNSICTKTVQLHMEVKFIFMTIMKLPNKDYKKTI